MFDFVTDTVPQSAQTVLFLSNPLGTAREWTGLSETIGARAICRPFDQAIEFRNALVQSKSDVHLVAHGSAAYHAL